MAEDNYFKGRSAEYYPTFPSGRTSIEKARAKELRALREKNLPALQKYLEGTTLSA